MPDETQSSSNLVLTEDWERVDDESQPLTKEETEMLEDIIEVKLKKAYKVIREDPD